MDKIITISEHEFYGITITSEGNDIDRFQWVNTANGFEWRITEGLSIPWAVLRVLYDTLPFDVRP